MQFPIFGLPREIGLKGAVFADAGTLSGFNGRTNFTQPARLHLLPDQRDRPADAAELPDASSDEQRRSARRVGASVLWASPLGPIRIDFAYPVIKGKYDQTQFFNFSGGASF